MSSEQWTQQAANAKFRASMCSNECFFSSSPAIPTVHAARCRLCSVNPAQRFRWVSVCIRVMGVGWIYFPFLSLSLFLHTHHFCTPRCQFISCIFFSHPNFPLFIHCDSVCQTHHQQRSTEHSNSSKQQQHEHRKRNRKKLNPQSRTCDG